MNAKALRYLWILFFIFLAAPRFASAAPGDEHWSGEFGFPGTATVIHAIARHKDRLYVGGEGSSTNTTARVWDGVQWSDIGIFSGNFPIVYDLAWVGNDLYAAGFFTNVNGATIKGLARWDGVSWTDIGFNGTGYALMVNGTDLYVGGSFTNLAGVGATNVALWNGNAWSALGNGLGRSGNFVLSLVMTNNRIYAGGSFTNSGSFALTNIAQWNGSSWVNVGGGIGTATFPDRAYSLLAKDGDIFATGIFTNAGGVAANGIARWDGVNWSPLGTGFTSGTPLSLTAFGNLLCVGGSFNSVGGVNATNFAIWNGTLWSSAGNGLSAVAYRVLGTPTNVLAGGFFFVAGNQIANQIASWDGATWSPIGPGKKINGINSFVRALVNDGANLFAGGNFLYTGQTNAVNVARFDGTNWFAFATGLNNTVTALAMVGTNLYAGGNFTGTAGGPSLSHLARWSGSGWVPVTNFVSSVVNALAARGNDLFIGGYFNTSAANGSATWLARWDGTNLWNAMTFEPYTLSLFALNNIGLIAVAADDNYVYVSGQCQMAACDESLNCTNCQNVMRFDGNYMHIMGSGLSSNANAIAVMDGNVFFGGPFTNAGGVTVSKIARWDGNAWWDVGGGVVGGGTINALAVMGTNLYAGGTFTNIGGVPANRIARWDGNQWSALGSGVAFSATAGVVSTLTVNGDNLYVGGTIRTAGGKSANFLARWNEGVNFDEILLRLSEPIADSGSPFQFTVSAVGVPTYVIERSEDLLSWSPVLTNIYTPYDYINTSAPGSPRGFYRARSQP